MGIQTQPAHTLFPPKTTYILGTKKVLYWQQGRKGDLLYCKLETCI